MDFDTKKITCQTDTDFITFYPEKITSSLEEVKNLAFDKIDDRINYLSKQ